MEMKKILAILTAQAVMDIPNVSHIIGASRKDGGNIILMLQNVVQDFVP